MYESYFELSGKPFQINPDPRFFYRSTGHKRALAYMRYGLQQEQGFIVVTGDVGTGKTMLVNNLFRDIEAEAVAAAKIVSTNVKDVDLLRLIAAEFDIPFENSSKAGLLHNLEETFKAFRDEGKRVLLVIDEAQNLPRSALEELRMLSNFDYNGVPLVQSFLLGQREFRGILRAPGLEQLRQRVIAAYHLKPLSAAEVRSYIEHRMHKVGWRNDPTIEDSVYQRIYTATGGVPRRINTLFDRVLLNCYLDDSHEVTYKIADAVCEEVRAEQSEDVGDEEGGEIEQAAENSTSSVAVAKSSAQNTRVQELELQLGALQQTVNELNGKLAEAQRVTHPVNDAAFGEIDDKRFPYWTAGLIAIFGLIAIVGITFGVWMSRG